MTSLSYSLKFLRNDFFFPEMIFMCVFQGYFLFMCIMHIMQAFISILVQIQNLKAESTG